MTWRRYRSYTILAASCLLLVLASCGLKTGSHNAAESAPKPLEITTVSGVSMLLLPGGAFTMGSNRGNPDEAPPHSVTVSPFAMDKFEVTQDQYAAFEWPDPSHFKDPKRPVEQVRWSDAALFCNERSRQEKLEPCYDEVSFTCNFSASGYRLPTEAEWEYAARARANTEYDFGDAPDKLRNYACFSANSNQKTDLVGRKKPNSWGFHDLYGNVLEWCHDAYDPAYYSASPAQDPRGPEQGEKRVLRGGAWDTGPEGCRAAARHAEMPGITDACFARDTFGFRCVRRLTPEEQARLTAH